MSGYLYFATNSAMPGLTKIGFTETVLSDRFTALQSTGVPVPFELYAAFRVEDPRGCEKAVHVALASARLADNREFFRIGPRDALASVLQLLLAHGTEGDNDSRFQPTLFSDLDEVEREVLAAYAMAPSYQRPNGWEWLEQMFEMTELDARHYFHGLSTKGYLREIRGTGGSILYDLDSRGVAYGRIAREKPEFIERFGSKRDFFPDPGMRRKLPI